jgi:hypothetical protein
MYPPAGSDLSNRGYPDQRGERNTPDSSFPASWAVCPSEEQESQSAYSRVSVPHCRYRGCSLALRQNFLPSRSYGPAAGESLIDHADVFDLSDHLITSEKTLNRFSNQPPVWGRVVA